MWKKTQVNLHLNENTFVSHRDRKKREREERERERERGERERERGGRDFFFSFLEK